MGVLVQGIKKSCTRMNLDKTTPGDLSSLFIEWTKNTRRKVEHYDGNLTQKKNFTFISKEKWG